ncbi:MAG: Si-specific NAD(P)(+) transhydrogenase [Candidatus Eisenbacteria bacterium]|uniref:NAD(P)(+) transhydrogenase (Si-specific) n=1 Tax=Eiseniibacteriota bacterium TaxID=2212470 RepID=A0A956LZH6_UNCEI|nr:Si-specific NAD(P)(+) transhydrogenase [Candidatus Eisenbacteria bacterium]
MEHYDLFVIGSGPAGQRAAIQAAKLGKRVGVAERRSAPGGVCLNTGTIPSKTFREAVLFLTGHQQRGMYGRSAWVKPNLAIGDILSRCEFVIAREIDIIRNQMQRNRITMHFGTARFRSRNEIEIEGSDGVTLVSADKIVIAVGTTPSHPPDVHFDGETIIDSDGVLALQRLPRTLTVVGGGVIGTEYASIFAALGAEVTLVDGRTRLLDFLDREIADSLVYQMRDMNVTFRLGEEVSAVRLRENGDAEATLKSGKRILSELVLYSVGRIGATKLLDLDKAGLQADSRGRISVNERYETEAPGIYAVGDIIGFPALASTSSEQGRLAACHAFEMSATSTPHLFPLGIYAVPEISMVGKTEEELTSDGVPYEFGIARYREIARGQILGDDSGLLKLLFHQETRQLLGVHIIGTAATELIHIGQVAMALGARFDFFVENVFNYPTFAECYKVAALDGYNKIVSNGSHGD